MLGYTAPQGTFWSPYGTPDVPGMPGTKQPIITGIYKPLPGEYEEIAIKTKVPPIQVVTLQQPNGETIKVATDANGETIAVKKEAPNILPLAAVAAALYFLF